LEFDFLIIGIYLGFGTWNLEFLIYVLTKYENNSVFQRPPIYIL